MYDPRVEARRWLDQAENDLAFARHALAGSFFHQVCFVSQQGSEKALKALHFFDGARSVIGHSVAGLVGRLELRHPALGLLRDIAAELDLFYIPTRYPNGLVEGAPHAAFTRAQAERAIASASAVVAAVKEEMRTD